jgi:hypothetical protein
MAEQLCSIKNILTIPFFLMMSMAGLMYVYVTKEIPIKQYIIPAHKIG